jgi:hypothetical protein
MTIEEIIIEAIRGYEESMASNLDIGSLVVRNEIAHKWKVTYCAFVIRETVCWRLVDIVRQAVELGKSNMIVGARIMTRAAIETISTLVYLNIKMDDVVSNRIDFEEFSESINKVFLGSRSMKDMPETVNVLTMIKKCEKKHKGILKDYEDLCETAHPSYVGLTDGYTRTDYKEGVTSFGNFWLDKFGHQHEEALLICLAIFEEEYNKEWIKNFESL